ncbi:MAG: hypothetical protein MZW92_78555 [Comamonadaceae bacterium]|nr:hypothetical protein [Comamonadaceae bacterium]
MTSRSLHARSWQGRLLVPILLVAALAGCARREETAPEAPPVEVKAITVQPSATRPTPTRSAKMRGSQEVDLRARR